MKRYRIIVALFLMLAAFSCKRAGEAPVRAEEEPAGSDIVELSPEQMAMIGVTWGPVQKRSMSETILSSGSLDLAPQAKAQVTSLVGGSIQRILVNEGQRVSRGQTLALVGNTEIVSLQKDYLIAVRQAELSEATLERERALHEKGAGVEKNLQQAQAQCRMDASTAQGIRQQLLQLGLSPDRAAQGQFSETVPVRSPIAGVIGEIFISMGSWLGEGTVLMNIYDNKALHADLNVFEADIAKIEPGQKVSLRLSDRSRTTMEGEVSFITAAMDPLSKSATVHVKLSECGSGATLLPNMFVSAAIHCGEETCDAVPDEAVVISANRSYVFVCEGEGRFRKVEVVSIAQQLGYTGITFIDPTAQGKDIVTSKAFYLESVLADHGEE